MNRLFVVAIMAVFGLLINAQPRPIERPSSYYQVDEVRNELGLDSKQFDQIYKAYEKFNNAVFNEESRFGNFQGSRPRGGMGGPGAGGFRRGGQMGGASSQGGGMRGGGPERNGQREAAMKERQKEIDKQEQKLQKTMKKIFKNNESLYLSWLEIRKRQIEQMFPTRHVDPSK